MASKWLEERRRLLRSGARELVLQLSALDPECENFEIASTFTIDNLVHHTYLDSARADEMLEAAEQLEGLAEQLDEHSRLERAAELRACARLALNTATGPQRTAVARAISTLYHLSHISHMIDRPLTRAARSGATRSALSPGRADELDDWRAENEQLSDRDDDDGSRSLSDASTGIDDLPPAMAASAALSFAADAADDRGYGGLASAFARATAAIPRAVRTGARAPLLPPSMAARAILSCSAGSEGPGRSSAGGAHEPEHWACGAREFRSDLLHLLAAASAPTSESESDRPAGAGWAEPARAPELSGSALSALVPASASASSIGALHAQAESRLVTESLALLAHTLVARVGDEAAAERRRRFRAQQERSAAAEAGGCRHPPGPSARRAGPSFKVGSGAESGRPGAESGRSGLPGRVQDLRAGVRGISLPLLSASTLTLALGPVFELHARLSHVLAFAAFAQRPASGVPQTMRAFAAEIESLLSGLELAIAAAHATHAARQHSTAGGVRAAAALPGARARARARARTASAASASAAAAGAAAAEGEEAEAEAEVTLLGFGAGSLWRQWRAELCWLARVVDCCGFELSPSGEPRLRQGAGRERDGRGRGAFDAQLDSAAAAAGAAAGVAAEQEEQEEADLWSDGAAIAAKLLDLLSSELLAFDSTGERLLGRTALRLFVAALTAYAGILQPWLERGELADPHSELLVARSAEIDAASEASSQRGVWHRGFCLRPGACVPALFAPVRLHVLTAGRASRALRLTAPAARPQRPPPPPPPALEQRRRPAAAARAAGGSASGEPRHSRPTVTAPDSDSDARTLRQSLSVARAGAETEAGAGSEAADARLEDSALRLLRQLHALSLDCSMAAASDASTLAFAIPASRHLLRGGVSASDHAHSDTQTEAQSHSEAEPSQQPQLAAAPVPPAPACPAYPDASACPLAQRLSSETAAVREATEARTRSFCASALLLPRRTHTSPAAGAGLLSPSRSSTAADTEAPRHESAAMDLSAHRMALHLTLRSYAAVQSLRLARLLVNGHGLLARVLNFQTVALATHLELLTPLLPAATAFFTAQSVEPRASASAHFSRGRGEGAGRGRGDGGEGEREGDVEGDVEGAHISSWPTALEIGSLPVTVVVPVPRLGGGGRSGDAGSDAQHASLSISLSWSAGWPSSLLVDAAVLARYTRVTSLLLRLQCARQALAQVDWQGAGAGRQAAGSPPLLDLRPHAVQLLRWRVSHFLCALQSHLATNIIGALRARLEKEAEAAVSVDEVMALHQTFLSELEVGCFLHERAERVYDALIAVVQMALQLRALLDGRLLMSARALAHSFDSCHSFLARVLHELRNSGVTSAQPGALLLAMDFNGFHQTDLFP